MPLVVKSAARAFEVLEVFSIERRPLSQRELIRILKYPQSSMTSMLKTLIGSGYLTYDRVSREYFPTTKLHRLSAWMDQSAFGMLLANGVVTALLEEMRDRTGETVAICTQNDIYVQWHRVLESNHPIRLHLPEDAMLSLTSTSHGFMLMAELGPLKLDKLARLLVARTKASEPTISVPEIVGRVNDARRDGHCFHVNSQLGGASISMLLPITLSGKPVSCGIGSVRERVEAKRDQIVETMAHVLANYRNRLMEIYAEPAFGGTAHS